MPDGWSTKFFFSLFFHVKKTTNECGLLLLSPTAEAVNTAANPDAESAAPEASPDKPKEDVARPSSPAATEPTVEEKTDDEGVESNQTSVESLKETNVNNSNSRDLIPQRGLHF